MLDCCINFGYSERIVRIFKSKNEIVSGKIAITKVCVQPFHHARIVCFAVYSAKVLPDDLFVLFFAKYREIRALYLIADICEPLISIGNLQIKERICYQRFRFRTYQRMKIS